ncbi:unnamed protein product [Discula destructiva]
MAPDNASVATNSPLPALSTAAPPVTSASSPSLPPASSPAHASAGPTPVSSNKRPRQNSPTCPSPPASSTTHYSRDYSATKVARLSLTVQLSPPLQLTGAAALQEERRRKEEDERRNPPGVSENPNRKALNDLMSGETLAVSRPQDAPSNMEEIGALAAEATKALHPVTIPQPNVSDARTDISPPPSTSSTAGAAELQAAMNSPGAMEVDPRDDRQNYPSQPDAQMDEKTATSFSYPGILAPGSGAPASVSPQRHSSLPRNGEHTSSSSKKHKCPYCETEFTRHHNLKSHLLTHSQEKPYLCQECKLRFRRLHDLKRHGKLHTGEKNHECPKCGRKFARGDALARHNKGSGGCAGRRTSMGSYDDGEYDGPSRNDGDDSAMSGVVFDGNGEDMAMTEEDRRRLSLPAMKAHHTSGHAENLTPNSRSYPPASRPGAPAHLYPSTVDRSSNATASSSLVNNIAGITESPKPLSPAVHDQTRQRSPSQATAYQPPPPQPLQPLQPQQQTQFTRRPSDRELPALPPLPPPHGHAAPGSAANTAVNSRHASGLSSHANSGDSTANLFAQGDQGVWSYIQQLEQNQKELSERLIHMENISNARDARLASLESTLAQRDTKIGWLELELTSLRKDVVDGRQQQND